MSRVLGSLLIVFVATFGLAPGLPGAAPALAQGSGGSGQMIHEGGEFGVMIHEGGSIADASGQPTGMLPGTNVLPTMMGPMLGMMGPMDGLTMPHHSMMDLTRSGRTRGCGSGQQSVSAGAISDLPSVTINIRDGVFLPEQVTIPAGTRVIWVNQGDRPHTTTSWGRWDSGVLMPGQSCEAWFVTPGSYDYLSIVAADGGTMTGTVTVQGSLSDVSPPSGSSGTLRTTPEMTGTGY